MSQLRGDYKSVWNSLSGSKAAAYRVVSGYTDEEKFHADAEDTIDVLRETVGVRAEDVVLEIGCGVGRVGRVLSPFVKQWIGCDVSPNMLRLAGRRLLGLANVKLVEISGYDLQPIADASVDVVYTTVVFMHLEEWDRYNYVLEAKRVLMADASDSPRDAVTYWRLLNQGNDCAFGSRFVKGGEVIDYPRVKLFVNRIANFLVRIGFNIPLNDTTNAFKAYRRTVIDGCRPFLAPHFNLTVELPLKAIVRGFSFAVTPISWRNRKYGVAKLKIKEMGSRYFFICAYVWLEKYFSRGDYRRKPEHAARPAASTAVAIAEKREPATPAQ